MAAALQISRNVYAHCEAGNTLLPGDSSLRFAQLFVASTKPIPATSSNPASLPLGEVLQLIKRCKHKLESLQQKLTQMEQSRLRAQKLLQTLSVIQADAPNQPVLMLSRHLDELNYSAEKILSPHNERQYQLLALSITVLEAEIGVYQDLLQNNAA